MAEKKRLLRIGQVSKLYGVSVETLRHYEKIGLLAPAQVADSGYRYYDSRQIWRLNLIRTLRKLDISLADIRRFLSQRTLESSEQLLDLQLKTLERKKRELAALERQLSTRKHYLSEIRSLSVDQGIRRCYFEARKVNRVRAQTSSLWEVDRAHKEIETQLPEQDLAYFAWGRAGVTVEPSAFDTGDYLTYKQAFIFDDQGEDQIPAADYLCLYYRGEQPDVICSHYRQLKEYMLKHKLQVAGPVLEVYRLDIHETDLSEEFLTEIQVPYQAKCVPATEQTGL